MEVFQGEYSNKRKKSATMCLLQETQMMIILKITLLSKTCADILLDYVKNLETKMVKAAKKKKSFL